MVRCAVTFRDGGGVSCLPFLFFDPPLPFFANAAWVYFVAWHVFGSYIMLNLFIAVILGPFGCCCVCCCWIFETPQ